MARILSHAAFALLFWATSPVTAFQSTFNRLPPSNLKGRISEGVRGVTTKSRHSSLYMQSSPAQKGTIQVLMSDTGGGHRASANALRDAFDVLYPGQIQVDIVDIYTDYGPFWPYNEYVELYKIMAKYSFLWKIFYEFGSTPFGLILNDLLLEAFCFDPFKECLSRPVGDTGKRADMIISVHPLCQELPLKILCDLDSNGNSRSEGRTTPFATVVTDLGGAHPTWFNKGADKCFVPSDALRQCAKDREVSDSQIIQYGLPIRKGFWGGDYGNNKAPDSVDPVESNNAGMKEEMRMKLGMADVPTVLVVGGGDGMGGITAIATALGNRLDTDGLKDKKQYQMVVVCGSNKEAVEELSSLDWGKGVNVLVNGFVNNMDEWMRASDAIVTKAGPGTIAEASICGLPCMLSSFLPGQEEGNVPFVEDAGFGRYSGNPDVISTCVSSWLESPEMMKEMQEAALKAARPTATIDIAKDLAQMLFDSKK